MKKITLLMLFFSTFLGYSQVKNYTFTQTAGTYTETTGGTLLGNASTNDMYFVEPGKAGGYTSTGSGLPIGFNFVFNGFTYDRFAVATEGWISLGTSTLTPSVNSYVSDIRSPMTSIASVTEVLATRIVALGIDLATQTSSTLLYKTEGTSPNQVLTVQWKNYRKNLGGGSFDFQIKLYETSNKIDIVYGTVTSNSTSGSYQVGLRATPSTTGSNFVNRTSVSGWDNTTAGTSTSDSVFMNSGYTPAFGLTYTWTPPTCDSPKNLVTSAITTTGATLTWDNSTISSGYEYVVSTSATLPTGSGTAVTTNTATLANLSPNTAYNVFMRSACGSEFSNWILMGTFRTSCLTTATFVDDFDSYPTGAGVNMLPYCWTKGGNGDVYVAAGGAGGANVASAPNGLYIGAKTTGIPTVAYAIMPKVSTLQLNTYRLKFKVIPISTGGTLDFGYFTDSNDVSTYVSLQTITLPTKVVTSALEFSIEPKSIPAGVSCLGFKNSGQLSSNNSGYLQVYIDDMVWEPIPQCSDVKAIAVNVLSTSAKMTWTPTGSETAWQYVYGSPTVKDPSTLTMTPVDVTTSAQTTIGGLATSTSYNVWVRSNCDHGAYGSWIGPVNFTTTCAPVTEFARSFYSSSSFPPCWRQVGAGGLASVGNPQNSPDYPSVLYMVGTPTISKAVVVMEPVSNAGEGTHQLKFKFLGAEIGSTLEVGYLTDINDDNSFVAVQSYTTTQITDYVNVNAILGTAPTTPYLAFRVPGLQASHLYINDVVWEPIPKCPDVATLAVTSVKSDSVDLSWITSGTESQWQYAVGPSATTNPYALAAADFSSSPFAYGANVSATVSGLTTSTTYKIWLRSKCNSAAYGSWIGPVTFTTTCAPITDFIQNFDAANALPACWTKIGIGGSAGITASTGDAPSAPNALSIYSGSTSSRGIFAMPPVSNADEGSHRLRFKFRGSVPNAVVEVGYLINVADASTFYPLQTFTAPSTTAYTEVVADMGTDPASQFLAFRNTGYPSGNIYIDDVVWETIPACANVTAFNANTFTSTSVNLAWIAGGSEKAWQYVVGSSTVSDPSTLTPVTVTASEITVNGLTPSTSYKIWVRSKCGTAKFGAWVGAVAFSTTCAPVAEFTQNFDSTTNIPTCWYKVGTGGTVSVNAAADAPSYPDVMTIYSSSELSKGVLAMQPVSNAGAGDHRLKFKFRGSVAAATLEVGYLINPTDANSFTSLTTFSASSTNYVTKEFVPVVGSNIQVLAFRNAAHPEATIYIDDVVWEAIPACPDITTVAINNPMSDSVNLSWTTDGTATAWQYVIGTSSDPNTLTPVNVTSASAKAINLTPSMNYNVWVRTKCGDASFGAWSSPISFTTLCASVSSFTEKFDATTTVPVCWRQVGTLGSVTVNAISGASSPNALALGSSATAKAIVALPNVSNASTGTQRLKFKFSSSVANGTLEVGYVTDINDPSTFVPLQSYVASSISAFDTKMAVLGTKPVAGSILAFRNPGTPEGIIYVDDVIWEVIPACTDVANVVVKLSNTNSVQLSWDATGTETAWQYAVTDPNSMPSTQIVDTNSKAVTVNGLTSNASYKIWVRSNCGNGAYGVWVDSAVFLTPCPSVQTITENFDSNLTLPACWHKIGTNGSVAIAASKGTAGTNALEVTSTIANAEVFVAIPPLNTAVSGGYRMRFKYKSLMSGSKIDIICYKDPINLNGTASFTVLKTVAVSNIEYAFDDVLPVTETPNLGLRIYNATYPTTVDLDDFVWELSLPTSCATGIVATPDAKCGNYVTAISWNAAPNAAGYALTIGTTSGGTDVLNNQELGNVLTYSFKGKSNTKYYYKLVPHNTLGFAAGCAEQTFTTVANSCYCISAPTANDGTGISNVQIGTTNFVTPDVTYKDFTASPVNLTQGGHFNLQISLNTDPYGYNTTVWIDSNDNFEFEPSEIVFLGKAPAHGLNVFDASFELPTMGLGAHTMRIGTTRFDMTPPDPCYNGYSGITLDFKVNMVATVLGSGSFDEINFSYYPNPVNDVLNLSFDQEIGNVSVMNLLGQQVISQTLNANQGKVDMSHLSVGTYLVKVTSGNQTKTIRVIKE